MKTKVFRASSETELETSMNTFFESIGHIEIVSTNSYTYHNSYAIHVMTIIYKEFK
ncbi:hypothetical protein NST55_28775 [Bacillus sp. FSL R10-2789]|uniref:hypothetical protein n=1 Tax=Bacillus sp. FSL R10-2789 TaxID=2954662 RepID=UPI0030FCD8AC